MAAPTWAACELEFAGDFSAARYRLLELQPELEQALASGAPVELCIKGPGGGADKDLGATLSTEDTTYLMRKAESSNTHLLLSPGDPRKVIDGQIDFAYELVRVAPRVGPLALLLQERAFDEDMCGLSVVDALGDPARTEAAGWSFAQLAARLQASDAEIRAELVRLGAFQLHGRWMTLAADLEREVLEQCISVAVEQGMDASAVSAHQVERATERFLGGFCILKVLERYATQIRRGEDDEDDDVIVSLDGPKVARFCAEEIFRRSDEPTIAASEFEQLWSLSLPRGIKATSQALRGLAVELEEGNGGRRLYRYFPASHLAADAKACFAELFALRKQWKLADLEPYIEHLVGPNTKKADLLRRFTRSVRVSLTSDERVLTAR